MSELLNLQLKAAFGSSSLVFFLQEFQEFNQAYCLCSPGKRKPFCACIDNEFSAGVNFATGIMKACFCFWRRSTFDFNGPDFFKRFFKNKVDFRLVAGLHHSKKNQYKTRKMNTKVSICRLSNLFKPKKIDPGFGARMHFMSWGRMDARNDQVRGVSCKKPATDHS